MKFRLPTFLSGQHMKVYALVGPSGTGKSFRSKLIADRYNIEMIIDDGLLIRGKEIIAGKSAKRDKSYLEAVRTAIFDDPVHREEVKKALHKQKPKSLLVLGTSDKMITRICNRLELPSPSTTIKINDVASKEEIEKAIHERKSGKHVIPVPVIEVEKRYPSEIMNALLIAFPRNLFSKKKRYFQKTIIQPHYHSSAGSITISRAALTQMVMHCTEEFDSQIKIKKLTIRDTDSSFALKLTLDVPLHSSLPLRLTELRDFIIKNIENYTGIILEKVDINIASMSQ